MASKPETGFLVIADLTGYTAYLAGSEIEHAPTIAGDLLETIVGRLEPPFRLMKFEGDAAFLFVEDGGGVEGTTSIGRDDRLRSWTWPVPVARPPVPSSDRRRVAVPVARRHRLSHNGGGPTLHPRA